jgi:hypothetical protein
MISKLFEILVIFVQWIIKNCGFEIEWEIQKYLAVRSMEFEGP